MQAAVHYGREGEQVQSVAARAGPGRPGSAVSPWDNRLAARPGAVKAALSAMGLIWSMQPHGTRAGGIADWQSELADPLVAWLTGHGSRTHYRCQVVP